MGKLYLDYEITNLVGADYNPRKITDDCLVSLKKGIQTIGIVKPIIARENTIVAGHQRCKALKSIGIKNAPVYILSTSTTIYDEVRFNQLHNGTDLDSGDESVVIKDKLNIGFNFIDIKKIEGNLRGKLSPVRYEISVLLNKYGNWGACVATPDGEVIHASQYALACIMTNQPLTVYCLPFEKKNDAIFYLNKQYGEFNYEALPKTTYIQTFAQKYRLRTENKGSKSRLYETMVIPWLNKNKLAKGLDFGCGQGDYVKNLSKDFDLIGLEFFYRGNGGNAINVSFVNKMIDKLIFKVQSHGLFDFIVCDSVLNSVDCLMAEESVMNILNMLVKPSGIVFFSGRTLYSTESNMNNTIKTRKTREIEFLDKNNFSALYRKGHWFYQKFHSKEQVLDLIKIHGLKSIEFNYAKGGFTSSFQSCCLKEKTSTYLNTLMQ